MAEAYIIDAVRTPRGIGKQGKGALEDALKENAKLKAAQVSVRDWPLCCGTRQLSKACSAVGGVV